MAGNTTLSKAKKTGYDEFYTRYGDIEAEMNAYIEYDPDVFKEKTVLLPCDDPEWSNFTKYFAENFSRLGLKKLISTSYANGAANQQITDFEYASILFDKDKHDSHGKLFIVDGDADGSGNIDSDDIKFTRYLDGTGDFRSSELCELRDEADIIITNPPFSQFRNFWEWVLESKKQFIILGNMNSITYKEVFPYLKEGTVWLGYKSLNEDMYFDVMDDHKNWLVKNKKEGSAYKIINGVIMGRLASACWFTNIEHGKRHELLELDTMAHNLKFNKALQNLLSNKYGFSEYPHYDNYNGLEVPLVECIPEDYDDVMGVPITFLNKHNPEQFDIIGISKSPLGNDLRTKIYDKQIQYNWKNEAETTSVVTKLNDGAALYSEKKPPKYPHYMVDDKYYIAVYPRILIKRRRP